MEIPKGMLGVPDTGHCVKEVCSWFSAIPKDGGMDLLTHGVDMGTEARSLAPEASPETWVCPGPK